MKSGESGATEKQLETKYSLAKTMSAALSFGVVIVIIFAILTLLVNFVTTRFFGFSINIWLTEVDDMILIIALAGAFVQATMLGAAIYMLHINLVDRSEEREKWEAKEEQRQSNWQKDFDQRQLAYEFEVRRFEETMKEKRAEREKREKREAEREKREAEREKREAEREARRKEERREDNERFEKLLLQISENNNRYRCRYRRRRW